DLLGRRARRVVVRLAGAANDVRGTVGGARGERAVLGVPRAAGRVARHLGRAGDDHVGAVRQLVAQRVRPRRQGPVATPRDPRARHLGDPARQSLPHAGAPEPHAGRAACAAVRRARGLPGGNPAPERDHPQHRAARFPERRPHRALLQDRGVRVALAARRGSPRRPPALARHDRGGGVHADLAPDDLDPAARAGDAEARPGVQPGDPHGAPTLPATAGRPRPRDRHGDAPGGPGPRLAALGARGTDVLTRLLRHAVVLHRIPAHAARPQLRLRRGPVGLLEPPWPLAVPFLAYRDRPGDPAGAGALRPAGRRVRADRPVVGQLDGSDPAMSRTGRLLAVGAIALVASAHVGSPDTYFEGSAGPYAVRVIVRNPGVVPGLAQITVRLLAPPTPPAVRRVLVLPVYWDPKTAAPPPPDVAERVPGDSTAYSAALWLMAGGSYSVRVTVEGDAGTGTALVPVMAVATRRLALAQPLGIALLGLGAFLFAGAVTIIGAAVGESGLEPGAEPDRRRTRRARVAMAGATLVLVLALLGGRAWWNGVDAAYRTGLYQPLHATATARSTGSGRVLRLAIDVPAPTGTWRPSDPDDAWLETRDEGRGTRERSRLADGSTMIWDRSVAPIVVDQDAPLRFVVTDPQGRPARLEPYMGMAGHA